MIIGNINDAALVGASCPKALARALAYLRETDFSKLADGRYALDADRMYAEVQRYTTQSAAVCRPEAHRRYADVQFVAEGAEAIGWCAFSPALRVAEPYDEAKDVAFYERLEPESSCVLSAGGFAVLLPKDVHRPRGAVEGVPAPVTKVVVKISMALLEEDGI